MCYSEKVVDMDVDKRRNAAVKVISRCINDRRIAWLKTSALWMVNLVTVLLRITILGLIFLFERLKQCGVVTMEGRVCGWGRAAFNPYFRVL